MLIQNFDRLSQTLSRRAALSIAEAGLESISPEKVMKDQFRLTGNVLRIADKQYDLNNFSRLFIIGFGKGSAGICAMAEKTLGEKLTAGWDIDTNETQLAKIKFTKGDHPVPSEVNVKFTREVLSAVSGLTEKDLVLVVICGGGSAMFTDPANISLDKLMEVNRELLKSGADIATMNAVRKHLDIVKGGGLAGKLYPANVASLIFSDVPGNDLSVIASGTTVKDPTTLAEAEKIVRQYGLSLSETDFSETPKEDKYFAKVSNILMLSNLTALNAMKAKAEELGYPAEIITDRFQGEARDKGKELAAQAAGIPGKWVRLYGGETTVTARGDGRGGRNQELVLGALPGFDWESPVEGDIVVLSVDSDGWDNTDHAGAVGDWHSKEIAEKIGLKIEDFLKSNDSYEFFAKTGDGILTGRLPSNVADLILVLRSR